MPALILGSLLVGIPPLNLSVSDPLVAISAIVALSSAAAYWNPLIEPYARWVGVPLALLSSYGLALLIFSGGSALQWTKDAFTFASFFTVLALLLFTKRPPRAASTLGAVGLGVLLLVSSMLVQNTPRRSGFFEDPNLAGNWLACAVITLAICRFHSRDWTRHLLAVVAIVGMLLSGSFGSFVVLAAGLASVVGLRLRLGLAWQLLTPLASVAVAAYLLPGIARQVGDSASVLGPDRLDRSAAVRRSIWDRAWELWLDRPSGIGPGGVVSIEPSSSFQTHNDYLGMLVEGGLAGLGFWLLALTALFLLSSQSRPMVVALATSSLTINAINFRHIWYLIAFLAAHDVWNRAHERDREEIT